MPIGLVGLIKFKYFCVHCAQLNALSICKTTNRSYDSNSEGL